MSHSREEPANRPAGRAASFLFLAAILAGVLAVVLASSCVAPRRVSHGQVLEYPPAPRGSVVDHYHGTPVADPWRWMENVSDPQVTAWVAAENRLTDAYISRLPGRGPFAARLKALLDHERDGAPQRESGTYAWLWNPGQAEQDALRIADDPRQAGRVLVDPAAIRADGTVSIGAFRLSPDGRQLAYALSDGGSDWKTWHIRDVASGTDAPETLAGTKFTGVSWTRDGAGFYYSRYPRLAAGSEIPGTAYDDNRQVAVYFHRLGTPQSADRKIYAITDHASRDPYATVTTDGSFLIYTIEEGYLRNALYYQRLDGGRPQGPVVRLLDDWDGRYEFLGNVGSVFYLQTTAGAPRGRIIALDTATETPVARIVVPESDDAIEAAALIGDRVVVQTIHDVAARLTLYSLGGRQQADVPLPGQGSVGSLSGEPGNPEGFFTYTDFTTRRQVYRLDTASGQARPLRPATGSGPATARYATRQVFYPGKDGTRIPMTIVHRSDVRPDGRTPTVLYGYGGFNVSLLPTWSASRMAWIDAGGVYAQANLRGGGEYGEDWHVAGTVLHKQNVFDDFIAAAEWLVANGITSSKHLAIWGGSNGGLLVGAVLNQRPGLFAAAVPAVGVMDMLRYQTASLNARKWSSDYGLSEVPEQFAALWAYSPYHNIRTDTCYPPVLVQADANDDRVVPWHSYKYAAALQAAQEGRAGTGCRAPVLIRIETRSGHGAGASVSKTVNEYADQWAFVAAATGLAVLP